MRRSFFLALLLFAATASAQRSKLDCYRPPSYRDQQPLPRPGFLFGAGIQRPFLLSNANRLDGFRYAAKVLPLLRLDYRWMPRHWFGLAGSAQLYWEQYGLRFYQKDQVNEKSYMGCTLAKAGLSLVLAPSERFRLLAGASFVVRDYHSTSSSGGALLNQNSRYAKVSYQLEEQQFNSSTFFAVDAALELSLSRRFLLQLNSVYYLERSLPMSASLELSGQNGQENHLGHLDARQLGLGLCLLFRTGRLE